MRPAIVLALGVALTISAAAHAGDDTSSFAMKQLADLQRRTARLELLMKLYEPLLPRTPQPSESQAQLRDTFALMELRAKVDSLTRTLSTFCDRIKYQTEYGSPLYQLCQDLR
jgi:hypothetical protein